MIEHTLLYKARQLIRYVNLINHANHPLAGSADMCLWFLSSMPGAKLLETSIGVIENANYLSFDQKRDILFNNAVRFFRLDESKFK